MCALPDFMGGIKERRHYQEIFRPSRRVVRPEVVMDVVRRQQGRRRLNAYRSSGLKEQAPLKSLPQSPVPDATTPGPKVPKFQFV